MAKEQRPTSEGSVVGPAGGNPGGLAWLVWARANPLLAGTVLCFCAGAVGALVLTLPPGLLHAPPPGQSRATRSHAADPSTPVGGSGDWQPETPSDAEPTPGAWVDGAPMSPSARGLSLGYRYRALPPGGESRFDWIVQVRGDRAVLDGVERVTWQMDPPPKEEEELISRDRARDGFPLFGDGPGGWFGVTAVVRFKDGKTETLSRRVELPEPPS